MNQNRKKMAITPPAKPDNPIVYFVPRVETPLLSQGESTLSLNGSTLIQRESTPGSQENTFAYVDTLRTYGASFEIGEQPDGRGYCDYLFDTYRNEVVKSQDG